MMEVWKSCGGGGKGNVSQCTFLRFSPTCSVKVENDIKVATYFFLCWSCDKLNNLKIKEDFKNEMLER